MRILLMPGSYAPVLGGLQTVAHTLACYLIGQGHGITVLTQRYPRHLPASESLDGVLVQRRLFLTPNFLDLRRGRWDLFLTSLYMKPALLLHLSKLLRHFQPEVVNVHFPDAQTPFVLWLRERLDFRLVVSLHGDDIERWFGKEGTVDNHRLPSRRLQQFRAILQAADAVTACSGHLLTRAARLEPALVAKGHVIYNGIDPARFADKTVYGYPRPYLFAWGRLTHTKGFDLLLAAFAQIAPQYPDLDLLLAGEGEEEMPLKAQAARLGLKERVRFLGRVAPAEVVRLLNGCRSAIVSSRQESFGMVALEALAAGAPLLATRVGGLPEFIGVSTSTNNTGIQMLVDPTVSGLRQGLLDILKISPSRRAPNPNRQLLDSFSWQKALTAYETVLSGTSVP